MFSNLMKMEYNGDMKLLNENYDEPFSNFFIFSFKNFLNLNFSVTKKKLEKNFFFLRIFLFI